MVQSQGKIVTNEEQFVSIRTVLPDGVVEADETIGSLRVLKVDGRNMTKSFYYQIYEKYCVDEVTLGLIGNVYGVVNDHKWCTATGEHYHVLWENNGTLYRSVFYPDIGVYKVLNSLRGSIIKWTLALVYAYSITRTGFIKVTADDMNRLKSVLRAGYSTDMNNTEFQMQVTKYKIGVFHISDDALVMQMSGKNNGNIIDEDTLERGKYRSKDRLAKYIQQYVPWDNSNKEIQDQSIPVIRSKIIQMLEYEEKLKTTLIETIRAIENSDHVFIGA